MNVNDVSLVCTRLNRPDNMPERLKTTIVYITYVEQF